MRKQLRRARAPMLVLLLIPIRAHAAAPLTLDDALEIFRKRGFDLLIADATVDSARADVTVAGALPNPSLAMSRGKSRTYDPSLCNGCSSTSIGAGVTDTGALSDIVSRRRAFRIRVATLALEAARSTRADVQRTLELNVKQQVLAAELAKRALSFASDAQALTTDTLRLAAARFKAGAVSEVDVARAEAQKLEADQAADIAQQNLETATYALAYLLGYAGEQTDIEVADDLLRGEAPAGLAASTRESLLAAARAHRPDLAAAASQVERARASIHLAKRLAFPDFAPSLQYSAEGRGQSAIQPPTVTLGVTATVPLLYRYRGEVAKARSDLHTQEIARQKIESQIAADVGGAWSAWTSSRQRLARMRERLLDRAARARDLVRLQYDKGAVSLFEFLDAQRTLIATQNESLSTLNDYWTAVFQLEQATATELRK